VTPTLGICGRAIHVALPIPGKSRTDWRDAWLSLTGPALGAIAAAWAWRMTT
jgi:glycerol uptake facilitator-like aquaporin